MAKTIGIGLALNGEAKYKQGIREVNAQLRLLKSETGLVKAQFADQANTITALAKKHEVLTKQLETQNKKVALSAEQMEAWKKVHTEAGTRVEELKQQLQDAEKEMEQMSRTSSTTEEELKAQEAVIKDLASKLENAEKTYTSSAEKVSKYQTSLNTAKTEVEKINQELKKNDKYMQEAESSSDGLAKSIDQYGKEVEDAKGKTSVFGEVLRANLAADLITKAVSELAQGIKKISTAAIGVGADFEASMSQVAATMGLTEKEIEEGSQAYEILEQAAEASGKATKYSASQAAEALNYLALAGYSAEKAAATLPSVLDVAAAGGLDLAYASDLVTDSMAALGIETDQLNSFIDKMAKTSQKSNTSIAQLGEATLVCAGTVTMAQQPLETMNTELGVLANNGIKGAEGGTKLRNILLSLITPTDAAAAQMKSMGLQVSDSQGKIRNMNDILTDLNGMLGKMSAADKANVLNTIFNKTDITAINALLKGTGEEFDNLYTELNDCSGAAADMANTMNANLTGKVTILKSALEGLGITAYNKFEKMFKNSVDEATGAVGRLQASMDSGKLGASMDEFSKSLGNAAEGAIDFAEDALPVVIDGLTWIMDNSELVISGITGIAAATFYHSTLGPAIQSVTTAWHTYKTANEAATFSQYALNTAMSLNPAGLLITAIVGVTAAVATMALTYEGETSVLEDNLQAHREQIDIAQKEIEARQQAAADTEAEYAAMSRLKEELLDLNSKEKLSNQEKQRMTAIVKQLNSAMPNLNLIIDEQTGLLKGNAKEISNLIDLNMEYLKVQAAQEDMTEIAEQQYELEVQLSKIMEERQQYVDAMTEAEERYNAELAKTDEEIENWNEHDAILENMARQYQENAVAVEEYDTVVAETQGQIDVLSGQFEEITGYIEQHTAAVEEDARVQVEYNGTVIEVSTSVAESLQALETAYGEAKTEAENSINAQVGLFDELSIKSDLTVEQMTKNLKSQTDTYTAYSENLQKAAELMKQDTTGNFADIVTSIMDMGINGAGYLNELVAAAEKGGEDFEQILTEWANMEGAKDTLTGTMADMKTNYTEQWNGIMETQTQNTTEMKNDLAGKTGEMKSFMAVAKDDMTLTMNNTMKGMKNAVSRGSGEVAGETKALAHNAITVTKSALGITNKESSKFEEIGTAVDNGIIKGIRGGKSRVEQESADMALGAYRAAKKALEINSPSKKFEYLADESTEGYVGKMKANLKNSESTIHNSMHSLLDFKPENGNAATANGRTVIEGGIQIQIQAQTLDEDTLDKTFEYVNNRLGYEAV